MKQARRILSLSTPLLIWACSANPTLTTSSDAPDWAPIFDGETLNGWTPKIAGQPLGSDAEGLFRVENGAIVVAYDSDADFAGAFGHLYFDADLTDYRLRLEYRFFGEQALGGPGWAFMNSGVMVHAQAPETMRQDQAFPVSVEAQFLGTRSSDSSRTTAIICTPGTHISRQGATVTQHCINSETRAAIAGEWVTFEIEVRGGDMMQLQIAGEPAFRLETPVYDTDDGDVAGLGLAGPVTHGYIALQAESHPVAFRNIQLMRLDPPS